MSIVAQCSEGDVLAKEGYISRVGESDSEREWSTIWNRNSKIYHRVLIYSLVQGRGGERKALKCGLLWQNVSSPQNHMCVPHRTGLYIPCSECSNWCPSCCARAWYGVVGTRHSVAGVTAAHAARVVSWCAEVLRCRLLYTMDFKWPPQERFQWCGVYVRK